MKNLSLILLSSAIFSLPLYSQAGIPEITAPSSIYQNIDTAGRSDETSMAYRDHYRQGNVSLHRRTANVDGAPESFILPVHDHHDVHCCNHEQQQEAGSPLTGQAYSNRHDTSHGKRYRIRKGLMRKGGENRPPHPDAPDNPFTIW